MISKQGSRVYRPALFLGVACVAITSLFLRSNVFLMFASARLFLYRKYENLRFYQVRSIGIFGGGASPVRPCNDNLKVADGVFSLVGE